MHRIELNAEAAKHWSLPEGPGAYYADDANTGEALIMNLGSQASHHRLLPVDWAPHAGVHPPGKILIVRAGGFGDLIMLTAVLRALHEQHPGVAIHVACNKLYRPVLHELGFKVTTVPYPVPAQIWRDFEMSDQPIVSLEGLVDQHQDLHPCDSFAAALGLRALTKPTPVMNLTQHELEDAHQRFPRFEGERRLGLQVRASALCRTWPAQTLVEFAQLALRDGWRIFIFGSPGDFVDPPEANKRPAGAPRRIVNLTSDKRPLSFRQSCAVLTTCDVIVAPDSALIHAAGALGLPALGLYGPFDFKKRTSIYPSVKNIQGRARCAPCNHQVRGGHEWPLEGPCQQTGVCLAMDDIAAERVLKGINAMLDLSGEAAAPSVPLDASVPSTAP